MNLRHSVGCDFGYKRPEVKVTGLKNMWALIAFSEYASIVLCYVVPWRMSWRSDVVWLHRCIPAWRSTSQILSGSQCCRLKVVRYRSSNCWMTSTVRSTTPYHVTTSTRFASRVILWWSTKYGQSAFTLLSSLWEKPPKIADVSERPDAVDVTCWSWTSVNLFTSFLLQLLSHLMHWCVICANTSYSL